MFEDWGAISSLVTGGLSGLLGTAVTGVAGYFRKDQEHKQAVEMRRLDLEEMDKEAALEAGRQALALEQQALSATRDTQVESYREATTRLTEGQALSKGQLWLMVFADFVRALMRPGVTIYSLHLLGSMQARALPNSAVFANSTYALIYIAVTASVWWYGARTLERFMGKPGATR